MIGVNDALVVAIPVPVTSNDAKYPLSSIYAELIISLDPKSTPLSITPIFTPSPLILYSSCTASISIMSWAS